MKPGRTPSPPEALQAPNDPATAAAWLAAIVRSHFLIELADDGTISRANAKACALLGYPEHALVGRCHSDFLLPEAAPASGRERTLVYRACGGRAVAVRATACTIAGDGESSDRALLVGHEATAHDVAAEPAGGVVTIASTGPGPARVDIGQQVRGWVQSLRPMAEAKGLALRCAVDPDLRRQTECDVVRLRLIVLDLVGTAIARTHRGWVSVCVEPAWNDPRMVAISVADTGETAARALEDTGDDSLALAITGALAQLIGASLTLSRQPGRGTRAEVRLPLGVEEKGGQPAPDAPVSVAFDRRRDGVRVLVVEDHPLDRARVLDQLERAGARGEAALDGEQALAMVAAAERDGDLYRLVLMDLHMPGMDGPATSLRLRAAGFSKGALPIVALTAGTGAQADAACRGAGIQGHLAKPVETGSLRYALDRWAPERKAPGRYEGMRQFDRRKVERQAGPG